MKVRGTTKHIIVSCPTHATIPMMFQLMISMHVKKRVLIAQNKAETKTTSGIIIDDGSSMRDSKTASVLAIGPEVTTIAVGDKVLVDWTKGFVVKVEGVERVMIEEEHIVGIIKE